MDRLVDTVCVVCGQRLGGDPEDEPDGEGEGRPICGDCNRSRTFDVLLSGMDADDGDLDGETG